MVSTGRPVSITKILLVAMLASTLLIVTDITTDVRGLSDTGTLSIPTDMPQIDNLDRGGLIETNTTRTFSLDVYILGGSNITTKTGWVQYRFRNYTIIGSNEYNWTGWSTFTNATNPDTDGTNNGYWEFDFMVDDITASMVNIEIMANWSATERTNTTSIILTVVNTQGSALFGTEFEYNRFVYVYDDVNFGLNVTNSYRASFWKGSGTVIIDRDFDGSTFTEDYVYNNIDEMPNYTISSIKYDASGDKIIAVRISDGVENASYFFNVNVTRRPINIEVTFPDVTSGAFTGWYSNTSYSILATIKDAINGTSIDISHSMEFKIYTYSNLGETFLHWDLTVDSGGAREWNASDLRAYKPAIGENQTYGTYSLNLTYLGDTVYRNDTWEWEVYMALSHGPQLVIWMNTSRPLVNQTVDITVAAVKQEINPDFMYVNVTNYGDFNGAGNGVGNYPNGTYPSYLSNSTYDEVTGMMTINFNATLNATGWLTYELFANDTSGFERTAGFSPTGTYLQELYIVWNYVNTSFQIGYNTSVLHSQSVANDISLYDNELGETFVDNHTIYIFNSTTTENDPILLMDNGIQTDPFWWFPSSGWENTGGGSLSKSTLDLGSSNYAVRSAFSTNWLRYYDLSQYDRNVPDLTSENVYLHGRIRTDLDAVSALWITAALRNSSSDPEGDDSPITTPASFNFVDLVQMNTALNGSGFREFTINLTDYYARNYTHPSLFPAYTDSWNFNNLSGLFMHGYSGGGVQHVDIDYLVLTNLNGLESIDGRTANGRYIFIPNVSTTHTVVPVYDGSSGRYWADASFRISVEDAISPQVTFVIPVNYLGETVHFLANLTLGTNPISSLSCIREDDFSVTITIVESGNGYTVYNCTSAAVSTEQVLDFTFRATDTAGYVSTYAISVEIFKERQRTVRSTIYFAVVTDIFEVEQYSPYILTVDSNADYIEYEVFDPGNHLVQNGRMLKNDDGLFTLTVDSEIWEERTGEYTFQMTVFKSGDTDNREVVVDVVSASYVERFINKLLPFIIDNATWLLPLIGGGLGLVWAGDRYVKRKEEDEVAKAMKGIGGFFRKRGIDFYWWRDIEPNEGAFAFGIYGVTFVVSLLMSALIFYVLVPAAL